MIQELIKIVESGKLLTPHNKFIIPYLEEIFNQTNFLSSKSMLPERIYCIVNNITKISLCAECNIKIVNFNNYRKGYREICDICSKKIFGKQKAMNIRSKIYQNIFDIINDKDDYECLESKREFVENHILKVKHLKCGKITERKYNYLSGCPHCKNKTGGNSTSLTLRSQNYQSHITIINDKNDYECLTTQDEFIKNGILKVKCLKCGKITERKYNYLSGCPHCQYKKVGITGKKTKRSRNYQKYFFIINDKNDYECLTTQDEFIKTGILKIKHKECGKITERKTEYLNNCPYCWKKITEKKKKISVRSQNYQIHINKINKKDNYECLTTQDEFIKTGILKIKCLLCGRIKERKNQYLTGCPHCVINHSALEDEIMIFLQNNINKNIIQGSRILKKYNEITNTNSTLEIDILIPKKNLGIEFDGIYWHSELHGKDKKYHLLKTELAKKQDIQLIHIFENEWVMKKDIVKSVILSKLGIYQERIYARKCEIKKITSQIKNEFLDENHLQGKDNSKYKIGLFYNNILLSVMTFGRRKITGSKPQTELIRFCSKQNTQIIGGANKLFSYYLKNLHDGSKIITYADRRYSDGKFYEKLGFKLNHISPPNYWYFKIGKFFSLFHRVNFQKHKLKDKLEIFDANLTEWENMQLNGYNRIWDCGNYVFNYQ